MKETSKQNVHYIVIISFRRRRRFVCFSSIGLNRYMIAEREREREREKIRKLKTNQRTNQCV
jgi:hypothetical protein